jgi:putative oxidoreductase
MMAIPTISACRAPQAMTVVRVVVALLLAIHGWARFIAGGVVPFGAWLDSLGLPFGLGIAVAITVYEIVGTPLLAWGRWWTTELCIVYVVIYATGIALVHWPAGWFVVGLGRNGMEYSVLLIACLVAIAWQHATWRFAAAAPDVSPVPPAARTPTPRPSQNVRATPSLAAGASRRPPTSRP